MPRCPLWSLRPAHFRAQHTRRRYHSSVYTTTELKTIHTWPFCGGKQDLLDAKFPSRSRNLGRAISIHRAGSSTHSAGAIHTYPAAIFLLTLRLPRGFSMPGSICSLSTRLLCQRILHLELCSFSLHGPTTFILALLRRSTPVASYLAQLVCHWSGGRMTRKSYYFLSIFMTPNLKHQALHVSASSSFPHSCVYLTIQY